jgi:hypothetical protein
MTQGDKNKLLLILLVLLVLTSVVLFMTGESNGTRMAEKQQYAIQDTASISRIVFESSHYGLNNELRRTNHHWEINGEYGADPNMVQVLLAVLKQVQVRRPVPVVEKEAIKRDMNEKGIRVALYSGEDVVKRFSVLGNNTKTTSFFMEEGQQDIHIVELPGYDSYVAGIFEVTALDWRNRMVFNSTWRSLQRLELLYPAFAEQSVEIRFTFDFFEITGVEQLDTAFMMSFIDQFQAFQCNRFIDPEPDSPYDSLMRREPMAIVTLEDIDENKNNRVVLYPPLPGTSEYPGRLANQEVALFNARIIREILKKKYQFVYKED